LLSLVAVLSEFCTLGICSADYRCKVVLLWSASDKDGHCMHLNVSEP